MGSLYHNFLTRLCFHYSAYFSQELQPKLFTQFSRKLPIFLKFKNIFNVSIPLHSFSNTKVGGVSQTGDKQILHTTLCKQQDQMKLNFIDKFVYSKENCSNYSIKEHCISLQLIFSSDISLNIKQKQGIEQNLIHPKNKQIQQSISNYN